ncbi:hypothetical protein DER46DRAFT_579772 [Fusarium sp. MPI-SDFR-AT-0072]|nr:hypothetical protein DER46DRAFT_579772 [Fusarium sp. MPI-SDFR-AT-0072]
MWILCSPCDFIHNTEAAPLSGGEYTIYALESSDDSRRICIRIPKNRTDPHTSLLLDREAEFWQGIDKAGLRHFQPLLAFSSSAENPLRAPFLALGWAETDTTALDWIEHKIHRKITRAKQGTLPGGTVDECMRQMELIKSSWVPELDISPCVLIHGDLSGNNVIVDGNQCLVRGIIDLG